MEPILFHNDMDRIRQVMLWAILLLFVLAAAAVLILTFGGKPLWILAEVLSTLGLVIFLLTLAFLRLYYLRKPEVREKFRIKRQLEDSQKNLEEVQASLAEALQNVEKTRQGSLEAQQAEQKAFESLKKEIENRIATLKIEKDQEHVAELTRLQQAHLNAGLKANLLDPSDIPGVGQVLIEKLNEGGIKTAYDVTSEAIQAIPGFGESKALSLVRWREVVERTLLESQPKMLPEEKLLAIEEKYEAQIRKLQNEILAAQAALELALQKFQAKESQDIAAAIAQEIAARQRLGRLEAKKHESEEALKPYAKINFIQMLMAALSREAVNWQKQALAFFGVFAFTILGLLDLVILVVLLISARLA